MKIGVISDTHNYLDPQVPVLFGGVEHILHGGDIGLPQILYNLEKIAPVTAVLGNTDDPAFGYRLTEIVQLADRKLLVHHILEPRSPDDSVADRIAREAPAVVVFGHTHKPFAQQIGKTFYLNPGYAGKSRFGMPRSIALLYLDRDGIRHEFLPLG